MFESQKKEKLDVGKLEVSKLGVTQLEVGEPFFGTLCTVVHLLSLLPSVDAVFAMAHSLHNLVIDKCCRGLPLQVAFADVLALC